MEQDYFSGETLLQYFNVVKQIQNWNRKYKKHIKKVAQSVSDSLDFHAQKDFASYILEFAIIMTTFSHFFNCSVGRLLLNK